MEADDQKFVVISADEMQVKRRLVSRIVDEVREPCQALDQGANVGFALLAAAGARLASEYEVCDCYVCDATRTRMIEVFSQDPETDRMH